MAAPPGGEPRFAVPRRPGWPLPVHPGPVLVVGSLCAVPLILDGWWLFSVIHGLTIGISCLGLLVLGGWSRQISLMHAGITGCALYLSWSTADRIWERRFENPHPRYREQLSDGTFLISERLDPSDYLLCPAVGIAFAVFAYLVVGVVTRRLAWPYLLALTFACQFTIEGAIFTDTRFVGNLTDYGFPRPRIAGLSLDADRRYFYFVLVIALVVVLILHRGRRSRFGRALILAGSEPVAAAAAGISAYRYRVCAMAVAGACAGIGGVLQTWMYVNAPGVQAYSFTQSLVYLAVPVLAGCASLLAVLVVAIAIALVPQILYEWSDAPLLNTYFVAGVGMALGILLGPRGVGGLVMDICSPGRRRGSTVSAW